MQPLFMLLCAILASSKAKESTSVDDATSSSHSSLDKSACDPANITLEDLSDMRKMMGRWFEGLASPNAENHTCIIHEYRMLQQTYISQQSPNYTIGFEMVKTYREGGRRMRKGDREWADFWIYKIGPEAVDPYGRQQYEYAIVSNCAKWPVRVLVRSLQEFKDKYKEEILRWLDNNGFDTRAPLIQQDYSSCHFTDSVTPHTGQH